MARLSLDPPATLSYRIGRWFLRRLFGEVLDPFRTQGHNMSVAQAFAKLEQGAAKWNMLDLKIKDLAEMAAAINRLFVVRGLRLLDHAHARDTAREDRGGTGVAGQQTVQPSGAPDPRVCRGDDRDAAHR